MLNFVKNSQSTNILPQIWLKVQILLPPPPPVPAFLKNIYPWCSHKLCGNSTVSTRIVGIGNWIPIGCSDKFVGTIVPTKIVGTPNGGFPLAVPTNLSERHFMFNSAGRIFLFTDFCPPPSVEIFAKVAVNVFRMTKTNTK